MRLPLSICSCLRASRIQLIAPARRIAPISRQFSISSSLLKKQRIVSESTEFVEDLIEDEFDEITTPTLSTNQSHDNILSLLQSQLANSTFHLKSFPPSHKNLHALINSTTSEEQFDAVLLIMQEWRQKGVAISSKTADFIARKGCDLNVIEKVIQVLESRHLYGIDLESTATVRYLIRGIIAKLSNPDADKAVLLAQAQSLIKLSRFYLTNWKDLPTLLLYQQLSIQAGSAVDYEVLNVLNNSEPATLSVFSTSTKNSTLSTELKQAIAVILESVQSGKEEEDKEFIQLIKQTSFN